jgi:hypothetical protein
MMAQPDLIGMTLDGKSVYAYDGNAWTEIWTTNGGNSYDIGAGGAGVVLSDPSTGDLYQYMGNPFEWEQIGGPVWALAVTDTAIFSLSLDRQSVSVYDGSGTSWTQVYGGPALSAIYGGIAGLVVAEPAFGGDLYRYSGTPNEWELIGGPGGCAVGEDIFRADSSGVWVYDGSGTSWTQIWGDQVIRIYAGGWGLAAIPLNTTTDRTSDLYRYMGTRINPTLWEDIGPPLSAYVVGDNTVYGVDYDPGHQAMYAYDGSGTSWTQIFGEAMHFAAPHSVLTRHP